MSSDSTPTTLYRLYDASDSLLYVGIAGNPGRRFEQHKKDKPWWGDVITTRLEHFPTREDALAAESKAIRGENPRHNIAGRGGRRQTSQWDRLLELQPEARDVIRMAEAITNGPGCMCEWWYHGQPSFKSLVSEVVGWNAGQRLKHLRPDLSNDDLRWLCTPEAYSLLYQHAWDLMPYCDTDGGCMTGTPTGTYLRQMIGQVNPNLPWVRGMPHPAEPPTFPAHVADDGRWVSMCDQCYGWHHHDTTNRPVVAPCIDGPYETTGYFLQLGSTRIRVKGRRADHPFGLIIHGSMWEQIWQAREELNDPGVAIGFEAA